ncbi:unnamed protein product [Rotaria socialis]|uniref:F-box domain-containing protein n=2 Tax=Rotaria socialis TaxID=392032 RepID=A0A817SWJ1_9BILA|nr:unnamed protein product [Rotaria socialis]CAF4472064.1 unnamed protein product [Rotaria socialis]CAF4528925.1 unnamed protein product [Rotaria socialis]
MSRIRPRQRATDCNYSHTNKNVPLNELTSKSAKILTFYFSKIPFNICRETHESVTVFEILPNEIICGICEYLYALDIYAAFYNLNSRFRQLITNSSVLLNVNIGSMSKSEFSRYVENIITPNQDRIRFIYLSNLYVVDLFFSPVKIASRFIRLEKLVFDNIKSKYLLNIIRRLTSLPQLSSLTIMPIDEYRNHDEIYRSILNLPALTYCKMNLKRRYDYSGNPTVRMLHVTSPLEEIVILQALDYDDIIGLLACAPHLKRLDFNFSKCRDNLPAIDSTIASLRLTHLTVDMGLTPFDHFERITTNLLSHLQVLHISVKQNKKYLDANRWKQLISSSMPHLRIFDLNYSYHIYGIYTEWNLADCNETLRKFSSLFWAQHKWYFEYQLAVKDYEGEMWFFSVNPYR